MPFFLSLWSTNTADEHQVEVGPAGSLCSIVGVTLVEFFNSWRIIRNPCSILIKYIFFIMILLLIGCLPWIDNYAHITGLISGVILSFALLPFFGMPELPSQLSKFIAFRQFNASSNASSTLASAHQQKSQSSPFFSFSAAHQQQNCNNYSCHNTYYHQQQQQQQQSSHQYHHYHHHQNTNNHHHQIHGNNTTNTATNYSQVYKINSYPVHATPQIHTQQQQQPAIHHHHRQLPNHHQNANSRQNSNSLSKSCGGGGGSVFFAASNNNTSHEMSSGSPAHRAPPTAVPNTATTLSGGLWLRSMNSEDRQKYEAELTRFQRTAQCRRLSLLLVSLAIWLALLGSAVLVFVYFPILDCPFCQYLTCLPLGNHFCDNMSVNITKHDKCLMALQNSPN